MAPPMGEYVDLTLDDLPGEVIHSVVVHGECGLSAEQEAPMLPKDKGQPPSHPGGGHARQPTGIVSGVQRLTTMTSKKVMERNRTGGMGRSRSSAERGLRGLRFLDKTASGREGDGWEEVEKRFLQLAVDGRLPRENFGRCIGMSESKEFAGEIFHALARGQNLETSSGITRDELKDFWEKMTDQDFDSRLQIFFDMCDKNGDGKLSEEEVKEVQESLTLQASQVL